MGDIKANIQSMLVEMPFLLRKMAQLIESNQFADFREQWWQIDLLVNTCPHTINDLNLEIIVAAGMDHDLFDEAPEDVKQRLQRSFEAFRDEWLNRQLSQGEAP